MDYSIFINLHTKIDRVHTYELRILVETFCELSLYSIEKGYYFEIGMLGINGSSLVDDYPELAIIILDTLQKCFRIVRNLDSEMKKKQSNDIVEQIKFIEKSSKKKNRDVITRINTILTDYGR